MYDQSGGGKRLRTYNSCTLAWWHTYKHSAIDIWVKYSNTVFGPMWHELYPDAIFFRGKTPLPGLIMHLLYVMYSYPKWKDNLRLALLKESVDEKHRVFLKDLEFLVEYAIPQVCTRTHTHLSPGRTRININL
jgi:hypothetical protein